MTYTLIIKKINYLLLTYMQSLVEELKKHLDKQLKPQIEVLYSEYIV